MAPSLTLDIREHVDYPQVPDPPCNTHHHSLAEINTALGEAPGTFSHSNPPSHFYAYGPYAGAIAQSQRIPPAACHTVTFPPYLLQDFHDQFMLYYTGRQANIESLLEDVLSSSVLKEDLRLILSASDNSAKYFLRLPDASPKDSPSLGPITSVKQLLLLTCTSLRARNQFEDRIAVRQSLTVFLRPWDESIRDGVEFRVFVPPPLTARDGFKVAAISQYVWHKPLPVRGRGQIHEVVETAVQGAKSLLRVVEAAAVDEATIDGLRRYGFAMDLVVKSGSSQAQLVEINPFGALSGCGSCLFHWIRDGRRLYGLEEDIVVRISTVGGEE